MKPRSLQILPKTLMVCVAPLLACTSAYATLCNTNESNNTGVWTLPAGTNLLTGTTPSPATVVAHEGSDSTWSTVIDGSLGDAGGAPYSSCTPDNGNTVTFPLDTVSNPAGYDITSFDSYCTWGNSGRDNQTYMLQYSTVAAPGTFINIGTVSFGTAADRSTHVRLTESTGVLASGVHSVRLVFDRQENGYVGYREFVLQGAPSVACVNNLSRNDNTWPALAGPNLLSGIVPADGAPASHEGSSSDWATVTDGSLGDYTSPASSVTPNNGQTVTYTLDTVTKPEGYDITSFESYCAWGSSGRDDQRYTLEYSVVGAESTFLPLTEVNNHTEWTTGYDSGRRSTRTRITGNGGPMATGVAAIRLTFHDQENGYTGFREFVLRDTPLPVNIVHQSNSTNSWTLPTGTNLLAGATTIDPGVPTGANHGNGDITSSNWGVLTDGSVGDAGVQMDSVAPLNGTSVTYTLDTTVNANGYNLTSLDTYCAWGDSGRDDQNYTISYSTVLDPGTFIPIETVNNKTYNPFNSTHTRITAPSGYLATDVAAVKFDFANQENGYVGYREFKLLGSAVPLFSPLTWSGLDGSGGNADWVDAVDNNWTDGVGSSPFNTLAPLTFDDTGINTNIDVPTALTADSLTFSNGSVPYVLGGDILTVTNGIALTGTGSAVIDNELDATSVSVSGTGSLTLSADNYDLSGSATVSDGTLKLTGDVALGNASLTMTGGIASFTSSIPSIASLSGTGGTVILGDAVGSSDTELSVGDATSATFAGAITDASGSANGSLYKTGGGTLTLTGTNTYTGITTVSNGELKLGQRLSLYNGNTASWTSSNLIVYTALSLNMGGAGEFTGADVAALDTGGFDPGAVLGLDTTSGDATISDSLGFDVRIEKQGLNSLTLSGNNTFTGGITVAQGALYAANPGGVSIPSDLIVGNVTFDVHANMLYDNQFGPNSIMRFDTGPGAVNGKVDLRGTNQTLAGLESPTNNRVAIIQNDEVGAPGYTTNPGPCTLTVDVPTGETHSFCGIIRDQDGDPLSFVKTGPGTQELINTTVQGYGYSGLTTVEEGTLRIAFGLWNWGFSSNIDVAAPATLEFHASNGNYRFDREISGDGDVLVTGVNAVILTNGNNSFSNGITVDGGFLALDPLIGTGDGDGPGQTCVGGAMDPANVISAINGGTLSLDHTAALGNSLMLPEYAPSVSIGESCTLFGGTDTVAFVPNLTLDGGSVMLNNGYVTGGFNTNLAFVGTVVVGGSSANPSTIFTNPDMLPGGATPSANANASLGSYGLPGTTFQVADVTGDGTADLTVTSTLRDVLTSVSPLTKTGAGTMTLEGANTYTGDTSVLDGTLVLMNGSAIADTNKLIVNGGKVELAANETVDTLVLGSTQQFAGTYGSTSSTATYQDDSRFSGTGVLTVTSGPVTDPYELWASVIPNAADRDKTDDPDGDGFTNLEEYLFGTSPIEATASLATMETSGGNLIVRWCQRASATYQLQESTTLESPWPASSVVPSDAADQTGLYSPDYVRKEAVIPIDSARKFVRVEAAE